MDPQQVVYDAQSAALVLQVLTGTQPTVVADTVVFTDSQASKARDSLNQILSAMKSNSYVPGHSTRYEMRSIVWPVILQQAVLPILAAGALGWWLGTRNERSKSAKPSVVL